MKKFISILSVIITIVCIIVFTYVNFEHQHTITEYKEKVEELENREPIIETKYIEVIKEVTKEIEVNPPHNEFNLDSITYENATDISETYKSTKKVLESTLSSLNEIYSEDHIMLIWINDELDRVNNIVETCDKVIEAQNNEIQHEGHEVYQNSTNTKNAASIIWNTFKSYGWSDAVCAGILGNIMCEVGGQSLDIAYWLDINGYYGMCMWNKGYNPGVSGKDLQGQCEYLRDTLKPQFDSFGYLSGYSYDDFMSLTDCEEVAIVFAEVYERCTKSSYGMRKNNALIALETFK